MGVLKLQYWLLVSERLQMAAYKKEHSGSQSDSGPQLYPWCWPHFQHTFRFPKGAYPSNGITNLPRDSLDLQKIMDTEEKYKELQAFFEAIDLVKTSEADVKKLLVASEKTNMRYKGLDLFKQYWRKVIERAKFTPDFDKLLIDHECMPWQVARAQGLEYPDKSGKVSLSSLRTSYKYDTYDFIPE